VFVEFAIALPLLILLLCGLSYVSTQVFKLGRDQLADYVLEEEAHYVMERITHQARAARTIEKYNSENDAVHIYYNTVAESNTKFTVEDVLELQYYLSHDRKTNDGKIRTLYAKRNLDGKYLNPITGANSFGETQIVSLKCHKLKENVLHVSLEMESLVTGKKIKLNTAVFMPACTAMPGVSSP